MNRAAPIRRSPMKRGSRKQATAAEKRRFQDMQEIGCIACRHEGFPTSPADIHHIVEGHKREGHSSTIPLCPWHHRGVPPAGFSDDFASEMYGPSLAQRKHSFVRRYGSEWDLLREVNALLERVTA